MQYKTIVYELLQQRTELYEQLRLTRRLLPTIEALAMELRDHHIALTESLTLARPGSDLCQIPSQALELAVKDLEDHLSSASGTDEHEELSLDQAMTFIRNPSSREYPSFHSRLATFAQLLLRQLVLPAIDAIIFHEETPARGVKLFGERDLQRGL